MGVHKNIKYQRIITLLGLLVRLTLFLSLILVSHSPTVYKGEI